MNMLAGIVISYCDHVCPWTKGKTFQLICTGNGWEGVVDNIRSLYVALYAQSITPVPRRRAERRGNKKGHIKERNSRCKSEYEYIIGKMIMLR